MASGETHRADTMDRRARPRERGFSLIELMIALTVLLIGVSGILSMHLVSMRATAYSRHATEAAVLAEDKMEELRTIPADQIPTTLTSYPYPGTVDAQGNLGPNGLYTVEWIIVWDPAGTGIGTQRVTVRWAEGGTVDPNKMSKITMTTQRTLPLTSP
jgi:prepilin-type N-terminal cleavage/methylation domain-containing protein